MELLYHVPASILAVHALLKSMSFVRAISDFPPDPYQDYH